MGRNDANPALSAFTVVIGAVLGLVVGVLVGLDGLALLVPVVAGVLIAGLAAGSLGVVGARDRPGAAREDLPPEYDEY